MGIYELPDYKQIQGYNIMDTDVGWQWVEYATKNKYRQYSYPATGIIEKTIPEREHFKKIIKFIEEEFGMNQELK